MQNSENIQHCFSTEEGLTEAKCSSHNHYHKTTSSIVNEHHKCLPDPGIPEYNHGLHVVESLKKSKGFSKGSTQTECVPLKPLAKACSMDEDYDEEDSLSFAEGHEEIQSEDEESSFFSHVPGVQRVSHWLEKRKKKPAHRVETHIKVHYGLKMDIVNSDTPKRKFSDVFRRVVKAGSLDDAHRFSCGHPQESGYSSPNASAQQTPTGNHRLVSIPSMRRSLELSPQRPSNSGRPRMSLPTEHIKRTLDGRSSAQAAERRQRLSRGIKINHEDAFLQSGLDTHQENPSLYDNRTTPGTSLQGGIFHSSRRVSRPGSFNREESAGDESGFEEEELVELRLPPSVVEEQRDSIISNDSQTSVEEVEFPEKRKSQIKLGEFQMKFSDLKLTEKIRGGAKTEIYKGSWHGEVLIYTYDVTEKDEEFKKEFWNLATNMIMIRHENLDLFMGACVDPPTFAIVTGLRKGIALKMVPIVKGCALSHSSKVSVSRQVAQGMSYLHSRGIIHGRINPYNIFLEPKVKLSLLDHTFLDFIPSKKLDSFGIMPRGLLSYYPPEMMQNLELNPPKVLNKLPPTQQTDVHMFASLLYEIFTETPPLDGSPPHSVIYQIGKGKMPKLKNLHCPQTIKTLIIDCWHSTPAQRPVFPEILPIIQQTMKLHRSHSTSEPERLDKIGLGSNHRKHL